MSENIYKFSNIVNAQFKLGKVKIIESLDIWNFTEASKLSSNLMEDGFEGAYNYKVFTAIIATALSGEYDVHDSTLLKFRNKLMEKAELITEEDERCIFIWNIIMLESLIIKTPEAYLISTILDRKKVLTDTKNFFENKNLRRRFNVQFKSVFWYLWNDNMLKEFSDEKIKRKIGLY